MDKIGFKDTVILIMAVTSFVIAQLWFLILIPVELLVIGPIREGYKKAKEFVGFEI